MRQAAAFLSCWRLPMSGSADCGNPWRKQRTGISGLTLRAFLCCYVSSILSFMFLRKREGRKGKKMTEAAEKFIPIFVGLLLILRGLFWIVDGKKGNKRSCFFGIAAIMVGIIMFITVFFQVL